MSALCFRKAAREVFSAINPLGDTIMSQKDYEAKLASLGLDKKEIALLKKTGEAEGIWFIMCKFLEFLVVQFQSGIYVYLYVII